MKVSIGADHAGFLLKQKIKEVLTGQGIAVTDEGTMSEESVDYPDFARRVAEAVAGKQADYGILVCGTGIGMSIAANKVPGIRAAHVSSEVEARMSREHNDANVLAIGSRTQDEAAALKIVATWLKTPFDGGPRHQRRLDKIGQLEQQDRPAVPAS